MLPAKPQAIVLGDKDPAMSQENTTLALIGTDDPAQGSAPFSLKGHVVIISGFVVCHNS